MNSEQLQWILQQHKRVQQKYDDLPYHIHLQDVVKFIKKYKYLIPEEDFDNVLIAGWGHDIQEDTGCTYNDIVKALGKIPADIIYAVSNEKGHNRKERANDKYYDGIRENNLALYVKLCDRLANLTFSKHHGHTDMYKTYQKENEYFRNKLYNGMYDEIWDVIDKIEFTEKDADYYPNIDTFDEDTIWKIHLPQPIPGDLYRELYRKGIVAKKDLKKNHYYYGKCRNAKVALWNGYEFIYMRQQGNLAFYPEEIFHLEDDNGFDLFIPLKIVKPTENQTIKY